MYPRACCPYHCPEGLDQGSGMSMTVSTTAPTGTHQATGAVPFVVVGALGGLVWAAGLRSWMAQLVGAQSIVSWMTFTLILLPGLALGALLGWAAHGRPRRTRTARWLALSPLLLSSALLDPTIFK